MKKIIILLLCVAISIPCFGFIEKKVEKIENITVEQALQFSNELKELEKKNYDISNRLIVSANKKIDTMGAVATATGVENIYVLQYNSKEATEKAYEYYNSVSGINYVEYDQAKNVDLCGAQESNDFNVNCNSTVNCNIDDAIKLMRQENVEFSEITIGVVDTGIAINEVTEPRFSGGHTAIYNYPDDGTYDGMGHGTHVAGTIILNTPENVSVRSYQGFKDNGWATVSGLSSMMMLAIAEGCKVINCSFNNYSSMYTFSDVTDYAKEKNVIITCSAGNRGKDLEDYASYPSNNESVITVGACSSMNGYYRLSSYGKYVDIFAPGEDLTSLSTNGVWQYKRFNGTSSSAPVIASICALLVLIEPQITYNEIEDLLQLTGNATNEENCTSPEKVIADAYAAVKYLLDAELESCSLDYTVSKSNQMSLTDISLSSNEGSEIYYSILDEENIYYPFDGPDANKFSENSSVSVNKNCAVSAYAYAPGMAKSELILFTVPDYDNENGYLLTKSSEDQQYNSISYCSITDESDITVPRMIDNTEIQEIGTYCFMGNQNVETIILPYSVKKIGNFAFANCPNLKTVIAPGVTECGMYAFFNCENLETVSIPNLQTANTGLFKNCRSLKSVKCQPLTVICNQAFYGCSTLESLTVENNDFSFCSNTFYGCDSLTIVAPENSYMYNFAIENDIAVTESESNLDTACAHSNFTVLENVDKECLKDGYTVYICTECGYTYTVFDYCIGHQITATYYETSCDMYEHIDYKCENCSYSYTEILSYVLLPHDTYTVDYMAPTEDHTGRAYTYCRNCDTVLPDTVIPSLAPYSVTGKIVAAEDKDMHAPHQYPVAGACITVNDELVAVTNENGEFLANFGNGTYTAYVTYSNGLDTSFTFTVENASTEIESAVPIVACDWHKDGYINAKDYAKLKNAKDISGFDLNGDNVLNEVEENIFRNFITSE